jgi:hypothetical protein
MDDPTSTLALVTTPIGGALALASVWLRGEISSLRGEVAGLRALMQAHGDRVASVAAELEGVRARVVTLEVRPHP